MPSTRKFWKQVFTVTVLSEDVPLEEDVPLSVIGEYIENGDGSGAITCDTQAIDGPTAARLLIEQGSDPGFFMLTEAGDDVEEL